MQINVLNLVIIFLMLYPNVLVRNKLYPLQGDAQIFKENIEHGRFVMYNFIDEALTKIPDLRIVQIGDHTEIDVWSNKALREFF